MKRRDFIAAFGCVAALWPLAARAQQQTSMPVIGFMSSRSPEASVVAAFLRGLGEGGLVFLDASTDAELDAAFASLVQQRAGGLVITSNPFIAGHVDQIVALAARYAMPTIYPLREFAMAGGLMSYGLSITEAYRQVGFYAARILNGVKPVDLPVKM